eukprot:CAMPEP_0167759528 /NCGR_PEP_ID=MMETSP0110_2-20121227/11076_1 /TAXON_ID=629695 /ORGANISM="Gymnochlora sp., Strain CCMP2014" /LENGTH=209 /DNA_ID=CAMNT_0007645929 /DNA_START=166 /DNA_END=795 /DNA_ORIENTATION=-
MSVVENIPFILKGTYLDGKVTLPTPIPRAEIEYSVHKLHPIIRRHCKRIFPSLAKKVSTSKKEGKTSLESLLCIPTFQHCKCDMLEFTEIAESEKDAKLKSFYAWCQALCDELIKKGHWADYIDPCSGYPVIGDGGSSVYNEVEGMQLLLRYRHQQVGMCKVILHPRWGQRIYPASMFTTAPLTVVQEAVKIIEKKYQINPAKKGEEKA